MSRVTIRLDEKLQEELEREVKKTGIAKSEFVRLAIREKVNQESTTNSVSQLCKISTIYNHIIDKYEVSDSEKKELKKEIELIWKN